jgi:hypothetical protein
MRNRSRTHKRPRRRADNQSIAPASLRVIYRIGGVLAGLDLFGSERTFARAFSKLVRGSAAGPRPL